MDGHYAQATHTCNYCSKVVPTYGELVEHKKTHIGDRPFSCHICHKRFTQKAHLNIHKRTHTGEKPYSCHVCHKRFAQSSHLNSHKRVHAGDRPFFCVLCNTGFSQKHRFDAHLPCMHQSSTARGSNMVASNAVTPDVHSDSAHAAPTSATAGGAAAFAAAGGNIDDDDCSFSDQKPDMSYLQSLSQQAFIHQLAEIGVPNNTSVGNPFDIGHDHEDSRASGSCSGSEVTGTAGNEDMRTPSSMSATYMPASSTHRRKPAFIRRVDNDSTGVNEVAMLLSPEDGDEGQRSFINGHEMTEEMSSSSHNNGSFHSDGIHSNNSQEFSSMRSQPPDHNGKCSDKQPPGPVPANQSLLPMRISPKDGGIARPGNFSDKSQSSAASLSSLGRTNNRITLINFTPEELLNHLTSRPDVHRCEFCCIIFQDAAMYHIHRNMHDKNDLRCCNHCGKMLLDKYDFMAHFLNEHR